MSGRVVRFLSVPMWVIIGGCMASNSASTKAPQTIEATRVLGEYVRRNLDTEERLVLRDNERYQWTQLVLQEDAPVGYSHTGRWALEENNIVLVPDENIGGVFEGTLHYMVFNIGGEDALLQPANAQHIDSLQLDRFIYRKVQKRSR